MALISPSIFRIDDLMKLNGLRQILQHGGAGFLGGPIFLTNGTGTIGGLKNTLDRLQTFLEFARKAHDVHKRSAQIVRDNIGKPLYFIVCTTEVRRALTHALFKPPV